MNPLLPLEILTVGDCAEVGEVVGEPAWIGRMAELGLRAGSRLQVLQSGSPCLLQVNGCRLCIRSDGTMQILVRMLPMASVPRLTLERC